MSYERASDRITPWISEAFRTNVSATNERFTWELGMTLLPGPNGQPTPKMMLYVHLPKATLGQAFAHIVFFDAHGVTQEGMARTVNQTIEHLLIQRSQELVSPLILPNNGQR